jgi:hypothetical protein
MKPKIPMSLFGVHTYKLYKETLGYICNPPTFLQAFFQATISYVDILNHQGATIEQNVSKSEILNVNDQTSPLCLVVLCMDTIQ